MPERPDLARWLAHASRDRVSLTGLSDHFVSEAIYLRDPDGHGIELYADRPRELWEGLVGERMTTLPLDVANLFAELDDPAAEPFDGLAAGTVMGHVHLKVAGIAPTVAFYRDLLGFGLIAQLGAQAAFSAPAGTTTISARTPGRAPETDAAPAGSAALRHATVVLPDREELERVAGRLDAAGVELADSGGAPLVRDPSGNAIVLATAA